MTRFNDRRLVTSCPTRSRTALRSNVCAGSRRVTTRATFARATHSARVICRSTPKEFARSTPREFARSTPKEFANSSPGFITLGGDNNADNNSERVGQLLRSCNSEEHEYSQGINPGLELATAFGVTLRPADLQNLRPADLQNLQDARPPEFTRR